LVATARARQLNGAQANSLFDPQGNGQFGNSAMTGYAIGSVLSEAVANSKSKGAPGTGVLRHALAQGRI
jgi:hypothetical protein